MMLYNGATLGVPQYLIFSTLGIIDTYWVYILPAIPSTVNCFLMKQFMDASVNNSLLEAARIDGASEIYSFHRIALPIMAPAIATMAIMGFIGNWNSYLVPMLIINKKAKMPLAVLITTLNASIDIQANQGAIYLAVAMTVIPILIVFAVFSKYIISSISAGAVKE
jgi:multiple sugar transport system permease protein